MFDSSEYELPPEHLRRELPHGELQRVRYEAEGALAQAAAHASAALAEMLAHLATFEATGGWADDGAKRPEEWLVWRCGVTPTEARYMIRIARKLAELPKIAAAFKAGELSYWQVRAMLPVASPEVEDTLLDMARYSTAGQLHRLVRAFKGCLDRLELEKANERHSKRALNYHFDDDGFLVVYGRLCPEDGAVLVTALEAAEQALRDEEHATQREAVADAKAATDEKADGEDSDEAEAITPQPEEEVSAEQWRADALVAVARGALAKGHESRAAVPEVQIHVDVPSLIDGRGERCEIQDGPAIASETVRRLTCDSVIQAVYERDGNVLEFGRKKRLIPARLRRALEQRDRTCRWPGCNRRCYRQGHHIEHWTRDGGETNPENCVLLCPFHHRLVHEGGFRIEGHANAELRFLRPDGREVLAQPRRERGDLGELVRCHKEAGLGITPETPKSRWDGDPVDYDLCVQVLFERSGVLALYREQDSQPT